MLFKSFDPFRYSYFARISFLALGWLILISFLHYGLNGNREKHKTVRMGYMPVITNLSAPLLDYASKNEKSGIRFSAIKFASFAEMAESLRNEHIQAAFIIAPLSIILRQQGEDIKVVYIGNRHESTLVVRKGLNIRDFRQLDGHTVAVPMRYSGHNLSLLKLVDETGFMGRMRIVEMNPPDMASALSSGSLDAYFVGEPFAAQTLKSGTSDLLLYVENTWPGFICNLLVVKQKLIEEDPQTVSTLVRGAARAGIWAQKDPSAAARIASSYWGQPADLIEYALNTPINRIVFDRFLPIEPEIQQIADLMVRFNLLEQAGIEGLVEDRFAHDVFLDGIDAVESILWSPPARQVKTP
jgi:NitT/TauT family transport system substrate-binding protein